MPGTLYGDPATARDDALLRIRTDLETADLVIIGASNGLDMAEGLNLFAPDEHFRRTYGDLAEACGARSILEGMYRSRDDEARLWAWHARFACREWLDYEAGPVLRPLRKLVGDSDCFVVTCNIDARFARAGFDPERVLETEGSVARMTCSAGCCDDDYPAQDAARALDASTRGGLVDPALIPRCPRCGAALACAVDEMLMMHPDDATMAKVEAMQRLAAEHAGAGGSIVVLELGVGLRNGVVKEMLAQVASAAACARGSSLTYAIFNFNQVVFPRGLERFCIGVEGNMAQAFRAMEELR